MMTFDEFAQQFNLEDPEGCRALLRQYEGYLAAMWQQYDSIWTYCCGCRKMVRRTDVNITYKNPVGEPAKKITRCKHCDTTWYVEDIKEDACGEG
jgi:GH24 family phage-related lysozyme (muramidase)